jgi:putative transposase
MIIHRASKFQLEPTPEQNVAFAQWAGACRFVYNIALEQRRDYGRKHRLTYNTQQSELTALRAEYDWLRAVPIHALQMSVRALDAAFQRFFTGLGGFPTPHKKGQKDSFTLPDPSYLGFKRFNKNHGAVKVPKVGWVKLRGYRPLGGELRSVTISHKAGKWFVSIAWRKEVAEPAPRNLPGVGIDRGVAVFAALSTGKMIAPLNSFRRIEAKLAKMQRRLARKTKFSANWKKLVAKISRLHTKAANARKDFLHKHSTEIAKSHGIIKIEKLLVTNMTASASGTVDSPGRKVAQKSGLNKSILDQGWSMFATMIRYKAEERGGVLQEVPAAYTSQGCSSCGVVHKDNRKSQSLFECGECGFTENADVNAARNIFQARTIAVVSPKRTLRKVGKRKQSKEVTNVAA